MKKLFSTLLISGSALLSANVMAQSMIEGVYMSAAGDNGRGACTVEVKSMGKSPKYGDEVYALTSHGEGACEWTAVGLSKNFNISAGLVSSGGHAGYINAKWPFGPGGARLEVTTFDPDGSERTQVAFTKVDSK
ncbi:hypothetical protein [Pseudohongiella spirulinae]|uniref:Secreted protein n=1 Tax=Pseudohongiella spirulinae TaxID=1249552 RepID=A0A0S2KBE9_9GAMM|nr:hypothetical protein [Pseudohongiella spirulinae]ALO45428.1 hypothetical protein PS2015_751 [Pseudohongiella spirulinae]